MYHTNEVEKYVEMLISTLFYNKFLVIDRKHFFSRPWNTDCSQLMMCGTKSQLHLTGFWSWFPSLTLHICTVKQRSLIFSM